MPSALEYAEEDDVSLGSNADDDTFYYDNLFGSDSESESNAPTIPNRRKPITNGAPVTVDKDHSTSTPKASVTDSEASKIPLYAQSRLEELRLKRLSTYHAPAGPSFGVNSLRATCMEVLRNNVERIWNIGEVDYALVAELLHDVPMDQLAEIESNSPHIMPDTDWLWEAFLLTDYPVYYETCRLRHSNPRTSGWRRMYQKGLEDAQQRQQHAVERVAERYRQLDEERRSRRIVVMDQLIPTKHGRAGTRGMFSQGSGRGKSAGSSSSSNTPAQSKAASAIAKARTDAQRARVALTHAAGKYIPPTATPPKRRVPDEVDLLRNPYLYNKTIKNESALRPKATSVPGPRLPPPRIPRPVQTGLPGAYLTADTEKRRAALPATIVGASIKSKGENDGSANASVERFKIDPAAKRGALPIPRPQVDNFVAPKPVRQVLDFFGGATAASQPVKIIAKAVAKVVTQSGVSRDRDSALPTSEITIETIPSGQSKAVASNNVAIKRPHSQDIDTVMTEEMTSGKRIRLTPPRSDSPQTLVINGKRPSPPSTSDQSQPLHVPGSHLSRSESNKLEDVLFRKRPKAKLPLRR